MENTNSQYVVIEKTNQDQIVSIEVYDDITDFYSDLNEFPVNTVTKFSVFEAPNSDPESWSTFIWEDDKKDWEAHNAPLDVIVE